MDTTEPSQNSAPGENETLTMYPIELPSDEILALKIPLQNRSYYLVEARINFGVDWFVKPGILVTLCDDRTRSGEGPVRVVDASPEARSSTKEYATFNIGPRNNPAFVDSENDVGIVLLQDDGSSYTVMVGSVSQAEIALATSQKALPATLAIDNANASIRIALLVGRTEGIDNARSLLVEASRAFEKGDFDTAIALAQQAKEAADSATYPQRSTSTVTTSETVGEATTLAEIVHGAFPTEVTMIAILTFMCIVVVGVYYLRKRRK
jgi:cellobiose-specific phosphotransferase system component IIA